jgi:hypothetical protein
MAEKVKFVIEVDDNGSAQVVDNLNQKVKRCHCRTKRFKRFE